MVTQTQGAISPWAKWAHRHSPFQGIWWGIRQNGDKHNMNWICLSVSFPCLCGSWGALWEVQLWSSVTFCGCLSGTRGSFLCNLKDKATRLDSPRSNLTEPALLWWNGHESTESHIRLYRTIVKTKYIWVLQSYHSFIQEYTGFPQHTTYQSWIWKHISLLIIKSQKHMSLGNKDITIKKYINDILTSLWITIFLKILNFTVFYFHFNWFPINTPT